MNGFPISSPEDCRLQTKLQVARNLFERVPNIFLALEQLRVRRVFEVEIFRQVKTLQLDNRCGV